MCAEHASLCPFGLAPCSKEVQERRVLSPTLFTAAPLPMLAYRLLCSADTRINVTRSWMIATGGAVSCFPTYLPGSCAATLIAAKPTFRLMSVSLLETPLTWESDLKEWLQGLRSDAKIDIVGMKPRERTPKPGHRIVPTASF